jgi:hypothetical protein
MRSVYDKSLDIMHQVYTMQDNKYLHYLNNPLKFLSFFLLLHEIHEPSWV